MQARHRRAEATRRGPPTITGVALAPGQAYARPTPDCAAAACRRERGGLSCSPSRYATATCHLPYLPGEQACTSCRERGRDCVKRVEKKRYSPNPNPSLSPDPDH